jgi:hypothetical protein
MSRSGATAPASPKENLGRPVQRLLLRLIESRSVGRRFDVFALLGNGSAKLTSVKDSLKLDGAILAKHEILFVPGPCIRLPFGEFSRSDAR